MSRLPLLDESTDPEFAAALADVEKSRGKASNALRSMGHAPEALQRFASVGDYVRYRSTLTAREREIVIVITGRAYEYAMMHHVPLALQAGIGAEEVDAMRRGEVPSTFSGADRALAQYALEFSTPPSVSDETFARLKEFMSPRQITDASFTAAYYVAFALMLAAMKPAPDSAEYVQAGLAWQLKADQS
ncbi:carboxymuconolactone decarboxylase family protein [Parapusillimonas granuli]|uniref:Carboxymuconolactone decarboxylase family protein n=1 Tax=Parapusillimonas granuli TaxID=380911 RepID=A0A853FUR6_9BURK|nr:carboxymuconolactone decarboxylase family protein [Parapusillimonas granuli]MBB5215619.1 4-carboxymuconolactone decarboxylase [Parapusillimonas granuli]MEB2401003.1 carboxymuconolactone decarboxylase family protein [Alcaligenaceae bacterium]NYT49714.1 carboxymuconolactone decarboxylase family protein [Parapusillimonas granuli]